MEIKDHTISLFKKTNW